MRVVLDTNVLVSGIFFSGPPNKILRAWSRGKVQLVVTPEILDEVINSERCAPARLPRPVCADPTDDKFFAGAVAAGTNILVSGDKHLLAVSGYRRITAVSPRGFVDRYMAD